MAELLINRAKELKSQGLANQAVIRKLKEEGFSITDIDKALRQIEMQEGLGEGGAEEEYQRTIEDDLKLEAPSPSTEPSTEMEESALTKEEGQTYTIKKEEQGEQQPAYGSSSYHEPQTRVMRDQVAALVEAVIDEKWGQVVENIGDIAAWREKTNDELIAIKQEILRVQERFDRLQSAVFGKIEEYNKSISDVGSEIKALEKVFERIIQPLTSNVKELSKITEDLKQKKK